MNAQIAKGKYTKNEEFIDSGLKLLEKPDY
ncbi:hypothetical protein [Dapis sp. BLCC M172]